MQFLEQIKKNKSVLLYLTGLLVILFLFSRVKCTSSGENTSPAAASYDKTVSDIPVPRDTSYQPSHELHNRITSEEWTKITSLQYKSDTINGQLWHIPVFSPEIKEMEGSTIQLKGYLIPIQAGKYQQHFLISVLPFNQCYYCGKSAGVPEMVEVEMNSPIHYTDRVITVRGILQLNELDEEHYALRLVGTEYIESK